MAIVGVLHVTSLVNVPHSNPTPAATILSHISDLYPTQTYRPFNLDHRLFVSTSSLLPHAESKRTFTHIFTSSHSPSKTYIGTTSAHLTTASVNADTDNNSNNLTTISVPTSTSLEPFTALLIQKLQPQWAPRQFLVSETGSTYTLPLADDAKWRVSVGDIRTVPSRATGSAGGQLRGVVIEIQYEAAGHAENVDLENDAAKKKYEKLFRDLLKGLFKNLKLELKLDDAKLHLTRTANNQGNKTDRGSENNKDEVQHQHLRSDKPSGFEVAELYMDVLRGPRG